MSEEMKMILALIDYLGLQIKANGSDVTNQIVDAGCFERGKSGVYDYTLSDKD